MPAGIRPTQNKVRKAIFDILGDIRGLSFLELFAGTGAVGIEALSQGAVEVVFVENDRRCVDRIQENLESLGNLCCRVLRLDAVAAIEKFHRDREKFDLIFLDPPYYQDSKGEMVESPAKKTLQLLDGYDILAANGFMIIQHFIKDNLPDSAGVLFLFKRYKYGDTFLSFYRRK